MIWAAALLVFVGQTDPRLEVTRQQLEGKTEAALQTVNNALAEREHEVQPIGFDYLRGHLLEAVGRDHVAHEAFAKAMTTAMPLAAYSRYRLALNQERRGHPEVAAGLLATLLGSGAPKSLVRPAVDRLAKAIAGGADCRLLGSSSNWRLGNSTRRSIEVAKAGCETSQHRTDAAVQRLLVLLRDERNDDAARLASDALAEIIGAQVAPTTSLLLGRTFHFHRRFDLSTLYLRRGLEQVDADADLEARYAYARSLFWSEKYLLAATEFGKVAALSTKPEDTARALYQQARCYELNGNWNAGSSSYRLAYLEETDGRWADAALISALRIEWRTGDQEAALKLYDVLGSRREWAGLFEKASVFLASSEIVRGRGERADGWLSRASKSRRQPILDVAYWQGRHEEQRGNAEAAAELYLEVLTDNPYHPLARAAAGRLQSAALKTATRALSRRLAKGDTTAELYGATLLAENDLATQARQQLRARLSTRATARAFLELDTWSPERWPLFAGELRQPEEMLLALGIWGEGEPAILKHFPVEEPALALTAVDLLRRAGRHRQSLRIAEILHRRASESVPVDLLPVTLRRGAYPMPYQQLISRGAIRFRIDPFLLTAIVREESRFDTEAVSAAAARGLAQFVMPTALRLGSTIGLPDLRPEDLHRPEIALTLGAAYLAELGRRFGDQPHAVVAAYNAGENQAALWQSYCFSREPEEYFSKVGFPETRGYLEKVLSSREHYANLYARPQPESDVSVLTPNTTSVEVSSSRSK